MQIPTCGCMYVFCMTSLKQGNPFSPYFAMTRHLHRIKGSLEVKPPTIWTDGKVEVGRVRAEKRRSEKIREEKE